MALKSHGRVTDREPYEKLCISENHPGSRCKMDWMGARLELIWHLKMQTLGMTLSWIFRES